MDHHQDLLSSSPDPLAASQQETSQLSPSKRARENKSPRKALGLTSGNAQTKDFLIVTPPVAKEYSHSHKENTPGSRNTNSPWRIKVTVQADQSDGMRQSSESSKHSSKRFAEHTRTITVPLKSADDSSLGPGKKRRSRSRSRGSLDRKRKETPRTKISSERKSLQAQSGTQDKATPLAGDVSPRRGRGRPRKSSDACLGKLSYRDPEEQPLIGDTIDDGSDNEPSLQASSGRLRGRRATPAKLPRSATAKSSIPSQREDESNENEGFDSVLESEEFSMVSVSTLSSAQQNQTGPTTLMSAKDTQQSAFPAKQQITPATLEISPANPPALNIIKGLRSPRPMNNPIEGTPKLARVVRTAIAFQGALSPMAQASSNSTIPGGKSPKERLDEVFGGFEAGTRRELRAGLRLGEELAKRHRSIPPTVTPIDVNQEDVFAPDPSPVRPESSPMSQMNEYSLTVPGLGTEPHYPSVSNAQLPSPARSEVSIGEYDQMSWRMSTPVRPDAFSPSTAENSESFGPETSNQPLYESMMTMEAKWQREREAVSKQIEMANSSQVIVIDSDSDEEADINEVEGELGDIWQEEAHLSYTQEPASDVPGIVALKDSAKPRRSQLPSPWLKKQYKTNIGEKCPYNLDMGAEDGESSSVPPKNVNEKPPFSHCSSMGESNGVLFDKDDISFRPTVTQCSILSMEEDATPAVNSHTVREPHFSGIPGQLKQYGLTILNEQFGDEVSSDDTYQEETSSDDSSDDDEDEDDVDDEDLPTGSTLQTRSSDVSKSSVVLPKVVKADPQMKVIASATASTVNKKPSFPPHELGPLQQQTISSTPIELPPAPVSWLSRLASYVPGWRNTVPAHIPLPSSPRHEAAHKLTLAEPRVIPLSKVDTGPLPLFCPWRMRHWYAFKTVWYTSLADPSKFRFNPKSPSARFLGRTYSSKKWQKSITEQDLAIVDQFFVVLEERGTVKGRAEAANAGVVGRFNMKSGDWIDIGCVVRAVFVQWVTSVRHGEVELGKGNKPGLAHKSNKIWTPADIQPATIWTL
ncbi:MAG: hypothetical protein LQ342_001906 [Letrouitia transgressa]|nr:MAG: hypothetical protein LQ342_001906 [Letrouitia transgressa]